MEKLYADQNAIIEAVRKRKPDVFEFLKSECAGAVRNLVLKNSGTEEDAKDVYNEGLANMIEIFDEKENPCEYKVSTFLVSMCKNIWLLTLTRQKRADEYAESLDDPTVEQTIEEEMDRNVFKSIFYQSFNKIKDDCQVILRSFMNGMRLTDIAEMLNFSEGYIRKRKHYCYNYLMEMVTSHPDYEG